MSTNLATSANEFFSTTTQRPTGCRLLSLSYVQYNSYQSPKSRAPWTTSVIHSDSSKYGTNIHLSDCHRRQGPLAWSPCQHRRQAASQWTEDCCRPLRGPQHLWRVLPRQTYVKPRIKVKSMDRWGEGPKSRTFWQTLLEMDADMDIQ